MSLMIYIISVVLLIAAGSKSNEQFKLKHACYTKIFLAAVLVLTKRLRPMFKNNKLTLLYGHDKIKEIQFYHLAAKISSFVIFTSLIAVCGVIKSISLLELAMAYALLIIGVKLVDLDLSQKIKYRKDEVLNDFPGFITDMALMVNAGLNPIKAWEQTVEYKGSSVFYDEAKAVIIKADTGVSFTDALTDFAINLSIPEINSFVSVLSQNIKNGGRDMDSKLREFSNQCWVMRKNNARKKGEQASTKLVFPLTLGLIGVVLILAAPAIMLLKSI